MSVLKNTLKAMVGWGEDARGVSRGKVVWRGENPRPPCGSLREQSRRRRQILAGQLNHGGGWELTAEARRAEEEAPVRVITLGGKRSLMDRLLRRDKAA